MRRLDLATQRALCHKDLVILDVLLTYSAMRLFIARLLTAGTRAFCACDEPTGLSSRPSLCCA